jgi:ornithine cyclodeaminase/alanine dehydrogenase-like protein (mu-crystallin family)
MHMRMLTAGDIVRAMERWPVLVDAADRALQTLATGASDAPVTTSFSSVEGQLLTMPGRFQNGDHAIVKLASVVLGNAGHNLPTIQGLAVLFDAHTGEPVAQLEGAMLTAVRTAAVSTAAARRLWDGETETMALPGAGIQAPWQTRALCSVLPIGKVRIWATTAAHRERFCSGARCRAAS